MKRKQYAMILPLFLSALFAAGTQAFADGEDLTAVPLAQEAAAEAPAETTPPDVTASVVQPGMTPEMQAMMAKFEEAGTPSEGHKVLEPFVGVWSATVKLWMSPNAEPQISTGTAETRWILGGRFLQQSFNGTAMGKPFQGIWLTGYDNIAKKYQTVWIDDMATGMSIGSGTYDAATKTLTDNATASCPMVWGEKKFRSELKWNEDGSYTFESYSDDPQTGKEFKGMEILYTKAV